MNPARRSASPSRGATLVALAVLFAAPTARAQDADVTKAQVQQAIDRATAYLKGAAAADGSYRGRMAPAYPQGVAALACYALLVAGVPEKDPVIQASLAYIKACPLDKTYSVGLAALALAEAGPAHRPALAACARWLEKALLPTGMYTYVDAGRAGQVGDNSNTQFGVLGLWASARGGVPIQAATWAKVREYFRGAQNRDGTWGYNPGGGGSPTMTMAGIASLLIASGQMRRPGPE